MSGNRRSTGSEVKAATLFDVDEFGSTHQPSTNIVATATVLPLSLSFSFLTVGQAEGLPILAGRRCGDWGGAHSDLSYQFHCSPPNQVPQYSLFIWLDFPLTILIGRYHQPIISHLYRFRYFVSLQ